MPRLFQNLRSTRETELAQDHPIHVVCAWVGNSPNIVQKHYLQVTDEDFERAADGVSSQPADGNSARESEAVEGKTALQKAKRQAAAEGRSDPQETQKPLVDKGLLPSLAAVCGSLPDSPVPPRGAEPTAVRSFRSVPPCAVRP